MNSTVGPRDYHHLQQEVSRLRERVKELESQRAPIQVDPANDKATIIGLETESFEVRRMELGLSSLSQNFEAMTSLDAMQKVREEGLSSVLSTEDMADQPVKVENFEIAIPEKTLLESSKQMQEEQGRDDEIRDLNLTAEENDTLRITGKLDSLIDIPFDIRGKIQAEDGNRIRFELGKSRVFGLLPVPGIIMNVGAKIAGKQMGEMGIEQRGRSFIMDADDFMPANVSMQIDSVKTEDGLLVLQGGSPTD